MITLWFAKPLKGVTGLNAVAKRKKFLPLPGIEPRSSSQ
jgi:hypothetical protein